MKKMLSFGRKTIKVLLIAAICFSLFYMLFTLTPAKWHVRFSCLCARAHFHGGEWFTPDAMLFHEIGQQELSDEHIVLLAQPCKRHNEWIFITIYGSREYSVRSGGQ